jgi:hypothetical protein
LNRSTQQLRVSRSSNGYNEHCSLVQRRLGALGGKLILCTLILAFVEGALRKWAFAQSPALRHATYFSKDALFLLAGLAGLASASAMQRMYANWVIVISVFFILPPSLANAANTSFVGAMLSFRAYCVLPWCAFLAAGTIHSIKRVEQIAYLVGAMVLGEMVVGLIQFWLPGSHWLNRYDLDTQAIVVQFGHVRATGTFSYISGMSIAGGVAAWAGTYLFLARPSTGSRVFAIAVLLSGVVCALLAMARGGLAVWLFTVCFGILCFGRRREFIGAAGLALLGYIILGGALEDPKDMEVFTTAMKRFQTSDSFEQRVSYFFVDLSLGITNYPFGLGLGVGQPGGYVEGTSLIRDHGILENEPARIIQEIGIPGILGVFLIRLLPFAFMFPKWRNCTDKGSLALLSATIPYLLVAASTNLAFSHTQSSVYWCLVALVLGTAQDPKRGGSHDALLDKRSVCR